MQAFGPYVVEAELGRGAAGVVFRGRDPNDPTATAVAIKVLLQRQGAPDPRAGRRMEREMRVLERLRHPSIVAVRATGETKGALWIAMDLVDGRSLQERLDREGPLPVREAASILLELAHAVAHAHAEGVLHRDLKPSNVLLDRANRPFLADFGLAKDLGGTLHGQSLSKSGQFLGTPGYWPPEQARGEHGNIGRASDVYGLGALLYAMLTGEPPSGTSDTLIEAMAAASREPPPPSRLRADVPAALDAICARCLRRVPAERYDSAADVAAAVQAWLVVRRPRGRARRRVTPLVAGGALLVVVAGVAIAGALRPGASVPATTPTEPEAAVTSTTATPLHRAAGELARLMAAGDSAAVLAFIDGLPPDILANEQVRLSRALTLLTLGLEGVTGGSRAEGAAHLERVLDVTRDATDPDLRLVAARALSALGRHDEAIAAFEPLLQAPGDLGAPLFYGALAAAERAFPEASRSFFSGALPGAVEAVRGGRHLNLVTDVPAPDVPPRDRARAHVALARALHASQVMASPDQLDFAIGLAPDDADARLARAERGLARAALDLAEADLRVVSDQEATLASDEARVRLGVLSTLLLAERLFAKGDLVDGTAQLRSLLVLATAPDDWSRAAAGFARTRRAAALSLPGPADDRALTPEEHEKLANSARPFVAQRRVDLLLEVLGELPPRARADPVLKRAQAVLHLNMAPQLAAAGKADEARAQYEHVLALTTPPSAAEDRVVRGAALCELGRWREAIVEYDAALRSAPDNAATVRPNALNAARRAFDEDVSACFLGPSPRPGADGGDEVSAFLERLVPEGEAPSEQRAAVLVALARVRHANGDAAGVDELLGRALTESSTAAVLTQRGEWHLARGRLDEADQSLSNRIESVWLKQLVRAVKALEAGDAAGCLRVIDTALQRREAQDGVWGRQAAAYVRALRTRAVQAAGGGGGG